MPPRDRLTVKEVQVATLVWQGLTNEDFARVLITSEQVVKNYLRTTFDKLGVWTRLELALYVASHGGANWHVQLGSGLFRAAGWSVSAAEEKVPFADAGRRRQRWPPEGRPSRVPKNGEWPAPCAFARGGCSRQSSRPA